MSWVAPSGDKYQLCLLDTNALSVILKYPTKEGLGFIENYKPSSHAPCLTIYNLFELRRKPKLFEAYCSLFSIHYHFLLKPYQFIWQAERQALGIINPEMILLNAFSPLRSNQSYDVRTFFSQIFDDPVIAQIERDWRREEETILKSWLTNRKNFFQHHNIANAIDAEKYIHEAGLQTLMWHDLQWVKQEMDLGRIPNINMFPSTKVMLYSQYYRLYDPHWKPRPQEVTDILITAASPYVDIVITEKFQAEILRKVRPKIDGMQNLEIATLHNLHPKR